VTKLALDWQGPFEFTSISGRSILTAGAGSLAGIYVWAVQARGGLLPHYVGETKTSFARRHLEHFQQYAGGAYSTRNGEALREGIEEYLYRGRYRRPNVVAECQLRISVQSEHLDRSKLNTGIGAT
jgi:hypothetical protein